MEGRGATRVTLREDRVTGFEDRVTHFDNFRILVKPTLETTRYLKGRQKPKTKPYACPKNILIHGKRWPGRSRRVVNLGHLDSFCQYLSHL